MRVCRLGHLALALTFTLLVLTGSAWGQNAEGRARGLNRDAMEEDYLATNMKAAVAKLQTAARACQNGQCSNDLLSQVYANLGIVYAAGLNQHAEAVAAFKQALRLQPAVTPDPNYLTSAVEKAFDEAKSAGGESGATDDRSLSLLEEEPFPEQATFTPLPVYVELPEGVEATRVVVRYRAPGQTTWTDLVLKVHTKGYGGYIPCAAVDKEGELQYFVTAFDANLDRVGSAGSAKEPRKVELKQAISGRKPALPGSAPPSRCPRAAERQRCETDDDCADPQVCLELSCVDQAAIDDVETEAEAAKVRKRNWVGLLVSADFMFMQSRDDACSVAGQADSNVRCYFSDGRQNRPLAPNQGSANTLSNGIAPVGTLRAMLTYDRLIGKRIMVGARLGYTFFGPPEDFLPIHAEARFAFHLMNDPFARAGVRPYAFAGAGFGPAAGRVPVDVVDATAGPRTLDAYQVGGPAFALLGPGVQYAVSPKLAMVLELSGKLMLPDFAVVIAPYLGASYGF